jgi:hypothetical protein
LLERHIYVIPSAFIAAVNGDLEASKRSRLKAANAATVKKYLKPRVIRDLD